MVRQAQVAKWLRGEVSIVSSDPFSFLSNQPSTLTCRAVVSTKRTINSFRSGLTALLGKER